MEGVTGSIPVESTIFVCRLPPANPTGGFWFEVSPVTSTISHHVRKTAPDADMIVRITVIAAETHVPADFQADFITRW